MEEYYVYAYLDPNYKLCEQFCNIYFEYKPIYIGKGKNKRMYDHLKDRKRFSNMFYNKLNKMMDNNEHPLVIKLKTFENEIDALNLEKLLIYEIKNIKNGGLLYNTTEGGLGCSGHRFSEESKNKMRIKSISEKHYLRFPSTKGENHPMFGKKHSKETKEKLSMRRKNRIITEETKKKISESNKGKKLSEETKEKLRIINTGKKLSEETKNNISKSKKGSIPWNYNIIKDIILQIDLNGNIIKEWNSLIELEKAGYQKPNIINVCNGKRNLHKGFKWMYKKNLTL